MKIRGSVPAAVLSCALLSCTSHVRADDLIKFTDLFGHTLYFSYDTFGDYQSLDGTAKFNLSSSNYSRSYIGEKGTIFSSGGSNFGKPSEVAVKIGKEVLQDADVRGSVGGVWQFVDGKLVAFLVKPTAIDRYSFSFVKDGDDFDCAVEIKTGILRTGETKIIVGSGSHGLVERLSIEIYHPKCSIAKGNHLAD